MDKFVISVLELNTYISNNLYYDPFLDNIWIKGEISDININRNTAYFVLEDTQSSVNCILFNYAESGIDLLSNEGDEVLLKGKITLFKKSGIFRIIVEKIEHFGIGALYELFQQIKEKLEKAGIFDPEHKRPIPPFPQTVGIVTSKEGAAIHDLVHIIRRRNPFVKIILYPVRVQGYDAPEEIIRGIEYFNKNERIDVLIVGRGGGSAEDLSAFNNEFVVKAVYNSAVPVISAVGHENDFTLTDLAADMRASTPSAAAELAVPLGIDILKKLDTIKQNLNLALKNKIQSTKEKLYEVRNTLNIYNPQKYIYSLNDKLFTCKSKLKNYILLKYNDLNLNYTALKEKLTALDPNIIYKTELVKILMNGYEVSSAAKLKIGDKIDIEFRDGILNAVITGDARSKNER